MTKDENWEFWLYIAGQTPKSILALENITKYSKAHLKVKYIIEVIDLLKPLSWLKMIRFLPFLH